MPIIGGADFPMTPDCQKLAAASLILSNRTLLDELNILPDPSMVSTKGYH